MISPAPRLPRNSRLFIIVILGVYTRFVSIVPGFPEPPRLRLSGAFAEQSVAVFHRPPPVADLLQFAEVADGRHVVRPCVLQETPGVFRGDRGVAEGGQRLVAHARFERLGEQVAQHVDVLASERTFDPVGLRHAVQLDHGRLEVVRHAGDALRADDVDVGVVGLVLGQLSVDVALRDVEYHAVFERAVALEPPRVLVVPHADRLRVPCLVFRAGVPAGDVHVVHAAVVEGRTFVFVSLAGCESRGHVADADDRQLADLALRDEVADGLVIPGIAQIEVHRRLSLLELKLRQAGLSTDFLRGDYADKLLNKINDN